MVNLPNFLNLLYIYVADSNTDLKWTFEDLLLCCRQRTGTSEVQTHLLARRQR